MSATVFGTPRYGILDENSATGMKLSSLQYSYSADETTAENNYGSSFASALFNEMTTVTCDGVITTKASGLTPAIADVITFANESDDTLSLNDKGLFTTADINAGTIITSADITRSNREFETGSLEAKFRPLVATNSPATFT